MNGKSGESEFHLQESAIRQSFDAASSTYDGAAVLQAEVRSRLIERLSFVKLRPEVILDLGAGTGHASRALKSLFPRAQVLALDIANGMLVEARRQQTLLRKFSRITADARRLPLREASVDLVLSNLMLQWCDPPDAVFAEVRRVLKPGGLFTFTTFGPDTLKELRASWARVDNKPHVNRFIDMHDLGDAIVRARLAEPVLDMELFTLTYSDVKSLMRELKAIGAHNVIRGRRTGLTGRGALRAMTETYENYRQSGTLPATYEVIYGQAWGALDQPTRVQGETAVPISAIGKRRGR